VGGLLGGLGRRMANRGNNNSGSAPPSAPGRTTFMTMSNEVLGVTTTVSDADVAIPAGFKEAR
jgi:hypothetical protein